MTSQWSRNEDGDMYWNILSSKWRGDYRRIMWTALCIHLFYWISNLNFFRDDDLSQFAATDLVELTQSTAAIYLDSSYSGYRLEGLPFGWHTSRLGAFRYNNSHGHP
jgi:hypothetical protein